MRKFLVWITAILLLATAAYGVPQDTGSSGNSNSNQPLPRYYIFVDNSESMKRMHYYERVLSIIYENVNAEFHFVAFGTTQRDQLKDFIYITPFLQFLDSRNFLTTDFETLADYITDLKLEPRDQIIIITDGEHDIAPNRSFSHLTKSELETMKRVVHKLKKHRKNIQVVHLLKNSPGPIKKITLERYIATFTDMKVDVPGFDALSDPGVIKALTHDFLSRLTEEENYFYCKTRSETVQALHEKIFNLSIPVACDIGNFSMTIPVTLSFRYVPSRVRQRFQDKLSTTTVCWNGIKRTFSVIDNQVTSPAFPVKMEWSTDDYYSIWVKDTPIWPNRKLYMDSDFNQAASTLQAHFTEIIGNAESSIDNQYPGFVEPRCRVSIRFPGNMVFPFLSPEHFKLYAADCRGNLVETDRFRVRCSKYTRRFYIELPMVSSRKITITYPHNDKKRVKEFPLTSQRIRQFWDGDELVVEDVKNHIPVVDYNFDQYLKKHKGTILLFSAFNRRYAGKIEKTGSFRFYKGMKYWFYHVPEDLETHSIPFSTRMINSPGDIEEVFNLLEMSREKALMDWKHCLKIFNDVEDGNDESKKSVVMKKLVEANGILLLLANLESITGNKKHKEDLVHILELYQDRYQGVSIKPFRAVNLAKQEIPGFTDKLKENFMRLGNPIKINIIIALLANPYSSLKDLRYYLLEQYDKVSSQNIEYFRKLEGVKK